MATLPPPVVVLKSAPKPFATIALSGRVTKQCIHANGRVEGAGGIIEERAKPCGRVKGAGSVGERALDEPSAVS